MAQMPIQKLGGIVLQSGRINRHTQCASHAMELYAGVLKQGIVFYEYSRGTLCANKCSQGMVEPEQITFFKIKVITTLQGARHAYRVTYHQYIPDVELTIRKY